MEAYDYTYNDLSTRLVQAVPHLREQYEALLADWAGVDLNTGFPEDNLPGQYIVYEDILKPYLLDLLYDESATEELQRIFTFLEELANHPDPEVPNLVGVAILEAFDSTDLLRASKYFGPGMAKLAGDSA